MHVGLHHYLTLACLLFATGLAGVLSRRSLPVLYMSLELMLAAATLALVAFSRYNNNMDGAVFVFFILTVAAAEVAVGLAILTALFRKRESANVDEIKTLKH
jgi:NADH-quinone oxidoreductase subunit K